MPSPWIISTPFDGAKFAARYGLDSLKGDFWMERSPKEEFLLFVKDGIKLPNDPPIIDPPDTPDEIRKKAFVAALDKRDPQIDALKAMVFSLNDEVNKLKALAGVPVSTADDLVAAAKAQPVPDAVIKV